jgi:hypothetical protein
MGLYFGPVHGYDCTCGEKLELAHLDYKLGRDGEVWVCRLCRYVKGPGRWPLRGVVYKDLGLVSWTKHVLIDWITQGVMAV